MNLEMMNLIFEPSRPISIHYHANRNEHILHGTLLGKRLVFYLKPHIYVCYVTVFFPDNVCTHN